MRAWNITSPFASVSEGGTTTFRVAFTPAVMNGETVQISSSTNAEETLTPPQPIILMPGESFADVTLVANQNRVFNTAAVSSTVVWTLTLDAQATSGMPCTDPTFTTVTVSVQDDDRRLYPVTVTNGAWASGGASSSGGTTMMMGPDGSCTTLQFSMMTPSSGNSRPVGTLRALYASSTRQPNTSAWPLVPGVTYFLQGPNGAFSRAFTTGPAGAPGYPMDLPLKGPNDQPVWLGVAFVPGTADWTVGSNCNDWTNAGVTGAQASTTGVEQADALVLNASCGTPGVVLCVEQ